MAVAVDTAQCKDNFLPVVDEGEEYEIMSETGVMYEMEDIEEMVFAEIRKILKARQRPFTESICKSLHKAKGLTRSTIAIQIQYMLDSGKIFDSKYRGKESLRITGEDPSLSIVRTDCDDKVSEYRNDLLAEASRHESEITDAVNAECSERSESICDSSLDSSPDTNGTSQVPVTFRNNENAQKNYASSSEVIERLEKVEGQVTQILQKIKNNEEKNFKNAETTSLKSEISKLLDKVKKLEEENKSLVEKNKILTREISGLNGSRTNARGEEMMVNKMEPPRSEMVNRQIFDSYLETRKGVPHPVPENIFQYQNNQAEWRPEVYRSRQHDVIEPYYGWQFPKETARKSNFATTCSRLETRNRFDVLECTGDNNLEERKRNVVPGEPHTQKQYPKHLKICHKMQPLDKDNKTESLQNLQDKVESNKVMFPGAKVMASDLQSEIKPK